MAGWTSRGSGGPARAAVRAALATLLAVIAARAVAAAQDRLGLAEVGALPGTTTRVTVYVRDVNATTLDEGDGNDLEIQAFAFRTDFPATWVTSVNFEQAGVTAGKTPVFPFIDPQSDHITVLMSFNEMSNPLAFTLDRPLPGDPIGNLVFTIAGGAPLGTEIALTLVAATATLTNETGTLDETVADGMLVLGNGKITLTPSIFANGFEGGNTCAWSARQPATTCP